MSSRGAALLRSRSGRPTTLTFVLLAYLVIGLVIGLAALIHPEVLVYSLGLHCVTFFTVGMAAIIESNDVLFDPKEDELLLHRPIHPSTLLAAKALALVGFTLMLAGSLNLFPTFFLLAAKGAQPWIPIVHIASTVLLVVFVCGAVVCSYGLILRLFGRERFESLAVYAQVGMTLLFVGGFQVLPRLVERVGPERLGTIARILLPAPPAWFAAIDATLGTGRIGADAQDAALLLAAGAGVLFTVLLAWIGVGKLAGGYGEMSPVRAHVAPRGGRGEKEASGRAVASKAARWGSANPLLRAWLKDPIEWSAFRLTAAYMRRDREIKLRMYSSMSMFFVLAVLSFMDPTNKRAEFLPLMMFAMAGTVPLTMMETIRMSSHYPAAEIFQSTPLGSAAPLFHGVRKASILFVQLPIACAALVTLVLRSGTPLDSLSMALPIAIVLPTLSLVPGMFGDYVPLSMAPRRGRQSSQNIGVILATMAFTGMMFGVAYAANRLGFLWVLVGVELVATLFVHRWISGIIRRRRMRSMPEE
jgi:hypothetical protein